MYKKFYVNEASRMNFRDVTAFEVVTRMLDYVNKHTLQLCDLCFSFKDNLIRGRMFPREDILLSRNDKELQGSVKS